MSADIYRNLEPIRRRFVVGLTEHLEILAGILQTINLNNHRYAMIEEARMRVHKIHGVGSMLGFTELGIRAKNVEAAAAKFVQNGALSTSPNEFAVELELLLLEMYHAITGQRYVFTE